MCPDVNMSMKLKLDVSWWKMHITSFKLYYSDLIMATMESHITSLTIVYSTIYSDADKRKHQSFASLAFVRGIHRWPVNSPHKRPVTRKMFPFDDVIMDISKHVEHCFLSMCIMRAALVMHICDTRPRWVSNKRKEYYINIIYDNNWML